MVQGQHGFVSVVIPVWGNYYRFLEECEESVRKQTYKDYEIIVVKDFFDLPTARNAGIAEALGEWILPLDADDKIDPQYLEKTIGLSDIVTTRHRDWDGVECGKRNKLELKDFEVTNQIIACSLFKKQIWDEIGGYDESMKDGYEDWDFWKRALRAGYKVVAVDEPLYWYRKHPDQMTANM